MAFDCCLTNTVITIALKHLNYHIFLIHLLVLVLVPQFVKGQQNVPVDFILDSSYHGDSLHTALEVFVEGKANLTLADSAKLEFRPFTDSLFLEKGDAYWGRIGISNQLDRANAPAEWVLSFSSLLTKVEAYVLDSNRVYQIATGAFLPISARDFSPISDRFVVKVVIPPGDRRVVYYRAVTEVNQSVEIQAPTLRSLDEVLQELAVQRKRSGFFNGFMFMILVYSLLLFFMHRDIAYLYYSGYVLALILWWSFNRGELLEWSFFSFLDGYPQYINFFKLATYFGLFCYLAFIKSFLELKNLMPWWDRLFSNMIWIGIPLLIVDAGILWGTNFSLTRADQLSVLYIVSFVLLTYLFLWPLYRTRDKRGIFIILGMLAMGGGFLLTAIYRLSSWGFTLTYFQIGSFIEVVIFSLGLAYRSNLLRQEKQAAGFALEKSRLQKQKQEAEAMQLRAVDEMKTRFYTNITHEFRTPLTVILGMAQQLQEGGDRPLSKRN